MSEESESVKAILSSILILPYEQAVACMQAAAEIRAAAVKAGERAGRLAIALECARDAAEVCATPCESSGDMPPPLETHVPGAEAAPKGEDGFLYPVGEEG